MPDSIQLLGVRVDKVTKDDLYDRIDRSVRSGDRSYFSYVNIHAINLAQNDPEFRDALNNASVVYCDGEGVRLGARIMGLSLPPRIVLTYWIWELCAFCEKRGYSVFLLGAEEQVLHLAEKALRSRFPRLSIAGSHHGYFDKSGAETDKVVTLVQQSAPSVLLVCFGMPMQEKWVAKNLPRLSAPVILFGGSTIDYTAGKKKVAPPWMTRIGLEWLQRLAQEPRRLWKRYLIGNPLFLLRVLGERFGPILKRKGGGR